MNVMEIINAPKLLSFSAYIGNRISSTNQKTSNARLFIRKGAFWGQFRYYITCLFLNNWPVQIIIKCCHVQVANDHQIPKHFEYAKRDKIRRTLTRASDCIACNRLKWRSKTWAILSTMLWGGVITAPTTSLPPSSTGNRTVTPTIPITIATINYKTRKQNALNFWDITCC